MPYCSNKEEVLGQHTHVHVSHVHQGGVPLLQQPDCSSKEEVLGSPDCSEEEALGRHADVQVSQGRHIPQAGLLNCSKKEQIPGQDPGPRNEGGGRHQATLGGQTLPQAEGGGPGPSSAKGEVNYTNPLIPHREGGGVHQATLGGQTLPQGEGGGPGPRTAEREVYYTTPMRGRRYSRGSHRMESSNKKKPLLCHLKRSKVLLVTKLKHPSSPKSRIT